MSPPSEPVTSFGRSSPAAAAGFARSRRARRRGGDSAVIRRTEGNTAAPRVAAAGVERVRTGGYEGSVVSPGTAASGSEAGRGRRLLTGISWAAAAWGLGYAAYRGYYALGGTGFLPGTPVPGGTFRRINAAATVILLAAAILPLAALPLWSRRRLRPLLLAVCWVVAVTGCGHALIEGTERVLSLSGRLSIDYPASVWTSVDRRAADLQDLFFNEPWFLLEGLAFGALGWLGVRTARGRRWWVGSVVVAVLVALAVGLLSATGVIGRAVIG